MILDRKYKHGAGGDYVLWIEGGEVVLQWEGGPGYDSGYHRATWPDTPENRAKAQTVLEELTMY